MWYTSSERLDSGIIWQAVYFFTQQKNETLTKFFHLALLCEISQHLVQVTAHNLSHIHTWNAHPIFPLSSRNCGRSRLVYHILGPINGPVSINVSVVYVCHFCYEVAVFRERTSHCRKLIDDLTYTSDVVCLRTCDSRSVKHESLKALSGRRLMFYVTRVGAFGLTGSTERVAEIGTIRKCNHKYHKASNKKRIRGLEEW